MSFISLEKKLPILIGSLVACALIAAMLLVRFELRSNAVVTAGERLALATAQLDELLENSVENRLEAIAEVAAEPLIAGYATGRSTDDAAVREALGRLRLASDSGLPIELRSADGQVLVSDHDDPEPAAVASEAAGVALPPMPLDSAVYGELQIVGGSVVYPIVVPVRAGDRTVAHIVQHRRIGTGGSGEQIEQLIGSSAEIFFTNVRGGVWTSLTGDVRTDAPPLPELDSTLQYEYGGQRLLAFATPVAGTTWAVVTQMPVEAALVGTGRVMRRLALVGLLLLLLGGLGAWLVSRSVTAPLHRLGEAADAIAAGDYQRRTGLRRDDEIGRLAASFDVMAERIDSTHSEIARRYEQAQILSDELESANLRLIEAIRDAEHARTEAQQASDVKSEFLATMSHEIRTPINAVIGYTELMELELPGPLTPAQREYLGRVRVSGAHLIALVNDVLDFAKIEAGQLRMKQELGSLRRDIEDAVAMLEAEADRKRIGITVRCQGADSYCGDKQRVQQILINLLTNAIKFSADGTAITVDCDRRESRAFAAAGSAAGTITWTCASVKDEGPGIPTDQLEEIFQPFVQGAGGYTRRHGGTGLGLAISRSLARMMDGDITVESEPGRGSTFTLWLPAR